MRKTLLVFILLISHHSYSQEDSTAFDLKSKAIDFERIQELSDAISFYDSAGKQYRKVGIYDSAYKYFLRGLVIREEIQDKDLAMSYLYLGSIHRYRHEFEKGAENFQKAIAVAQTIEHNFYAPSSLGSIMVNIAHDTTDVEYIKFLLDSAERSLDIAYQYFELQPIPKWYTSINMNYGHLETKRGNYSEAKDYFLKAKKGLEADQESFTLHQYGSIMNNIGYVDMYLGNFESSKAYLDSARAIAEEINDWNLRQMILENYKFLYHDFTINKDSLIHFSFLLDTLNSQIFEASEEAKLEALKFQYENEQSNMRLVRQREEIARSSAESRLLFIIVLSLLVLGLVGFIFNKRQMIKREKAFGKINDMLKEQEISSYNAVLEAQESERKRIASELHDKLGSTLSAAKLYLNHLEEEEMPVQESKGYSKGMQLLDNAVQDVRTISHAMASGVLGQFGLVPALKDLETTISGTGKIKMEVHAHGLNGRLPQNSELHIYRMIQELVSNALKHSQATKITVQLTQHENEMNVLVEDNGSGFDVHVGGDGIGLKNINHRADILGATVNFDSFRGRGTVVTIDVPTP